MSNIHHHLPLPVQSEWQGKYLYAAAHEDDVPSQSLGSNASIPEQSRQSHLMPGNGDQGSPLMGLRREGQLGGDSRIPNDGINLGRARNPSPLQSQVTASGKPTFTSSGLSFSPAPKVGRLASGPNHGRIVLTTEGVPESAPGTRSERDDQEQGTGEEGDFEAEEDELMGGESESFEKAQTAAERLAARRKMKRFR